MIVTNSTSIDLGFAQYVIGVGESLDVSAVAAEWFLRHGCTEKGIAMAPASFDATADFDNVKISKPQRKRSKKG